MPSFDRDADRRAWMRRQIIRMSYEARSAHLGSSLSCVEIVDAVLAAAGMDLARQDRDRVVMSKGHAAMAFYAGLAAHDLLPEALLDGYLADGSALWGHVTRNERLAAIDASTGSLGHGLGTAAGFALAARLRGWDNRVFCILSDGECDEGSTWEAAAFAGHHRLGSIAAIIDYNGIQSLDRCEAVLTKEPFAARWQAFGWTAKRIDGHDPDALREALAAPPGDRPTVWIARTVKGRGIPRIEDTVASHYKPALPEDLS